MPNFTTYPGVYVQEIPSGVRTIAGVGTSTTAFVGIALEGPVDEPVTIHNFGEFERIFGGLWSSSGMSYAVYQYFLNGGSEAVIVRVIPASGATKGLLSLLNTTGDEQFFEAVTEGSWFGRVYGSVDETGPATAYAPFTLTLRKYARQIGSNPNPELVLEEVFRNVNNDGSSPRYVGTVLEMESRLARLFLVNVPEPLEQTGLTQAGNGDDGDLSTATVVGTDFEKNKKGIYALEKADNFNILCIPPITRDADGVTWVDVPNAVWAEAAAYCARRRAILLVDPPNAWTKTHPISNLSDLGTPSANAALYFPRVYLPDPLRGGIPDKFAPSGVVAGVIARTDAQRGIWKSPAGIEARMAGVVNPTIGLTDNENGQLNPLGVNVLRAMPAVGSVVWGARTMVGADRLNSQWKYLAVRRVALHIEESLYRGIQWIVFEPNDESLWAQIRMNVGAFMHGLFRQGAFQGEKPSESYFVKCDSETTTQDDINRGVVNIIVGFAPLKPAEFVVIKLQQMAGQIVS